MIRVVTDASSNQQTYSWQDLTTTTLTTPYKRQWVPLVPAWNTGASDSDHAPDSADLSDGSSSV